jgi:hypothetical protein
MMTRWWEQFCRSGGRPGRIPEARLAGQDLLFADLGWLLSQRHHGPDLVAPSATE